MRSLLALRRTALASVVANVGIVVTGGAVRLTGSGLGCPTWPRCTDDSYAATPAMGISGAIEFGNRMLTFVVGLAAVLGVVAALRHRGYAHPTDRRRVVRLAVLVLLGVCAQALLGGLTVRTQLNPDVVGGHFLLSMGLIAAAYGFWRATKRRGGTAVRPAAAPPAAGQPLPRPVRVLAWVLTTTSLAVVVAGTLVTGSGPHAGDAAAARNGLDPELVAQVHADLVFLLASLTVAAWLALRAAGARDAAVRAAWLLGIIAAQGLVGAVQYATGLPVLLVGTHLAGACAVWLATLFLHSAVGAARRTGHDELYAQQPRQLTHPVAAQP